VNVGAEEDTVAFRRMDMAYSCRSSEDPVVCTFRHFFIEGLGRLACLHSDLIKGVNLHEVGSTPWTVVQPYHPLSSQDNTNTVQRKSNIHASSVRASEDVSYLKLRSYRGGRLNT
jgi:hypothetical protein